MERGTLQTGRSLSKHIGETCVISLPINSNSQISIKVKGKILDCRKVFDRFDYQVTYENQVFWINADKVRVDSVFNRLFDKVLSDT